MAPFTAGFTDSPMQIVDSFRDFTVFCGVVEATDRTIISRQTSTVPCSGIRLLSPPRRDVNHHLRLALKRESTASGQQDGRNTQPLRLAQGGRTLRDGGFLPHHDQHIAALQADKLFGKTKARAVPSRTPAGQYG